MSVNALTTIKTTSVTMNMIGMMIGTFRGLSRLGSVNLKTIKPIDANRMQIQFSMPTQMISCPALDMKKRKMKLTIISNKMATIGTPDW